MQKLVVFLTCLEARTGYEKEGGSGCGVSGGEMREEEGTSLRIAEGRRRRKLVAGGGCETEPIGNGEEEEKTTEVREE